MMIFGGILAAVGAILEFAVTVSTSGFNINKVGLILLIVGIVLFVAGLGIVMTGSGRHTVMREDVQRTPTGTSHVQETDERGAM